MTTDIQVLIHDSIDGHNAAIKAAAKVCADIARHYDPQNNQENALASELYSAAAAILLLVKEERGALASAEKLRPELAVWYGSMPESNGKSNWTAILYRKDDGIGGGVNITIDRSEYPDRVRYEADRVRFLIGEIDKEPWILDYDADKCDAPKASEPPSATQN